MEQTIETYIFSPSANWVAEIEDAKLQPQMLNRLLSGVLHPLIHLGHAFEFGVPGMLVEGLAMACVSPGPDLNELYPREYFSGTSPTTTMERLSRLASVMTLSSSSETTVKPHAFTVIARMSRDPELAAGVANTGPDTPPLDEHSVQEDPLREALERKGNVIKKYVDEWLPDLNQDGELQRKIEELAWSMVVFYGVGGLQEGKSFKADFFMMHLVTSSLFVPSILAHLSPSSQSLLLRAYFSQAAALWVSRGRPALDIKHFYSSTSPSPTPPGPRPSSGSATLSPENPYPNPWYALLASTLQHPDEHLVKTQRSLAHWAAAYGGAKEGRWKGPPGKDVQNGAKAEGEAEELELEGAEHLDGTLFVRVAGLSMERKGWVREGEEKGPWDFAGFWDAK